eukprot:923177-Amphidinium_carterae.3
MYEPSTDVAKLVAVFVEDADAWEAIAFSWQSPLGQAHSNQKSLANAAGIRARPQATGSLKVVAAQMGFWKLSKSFMERFAKEVVMVEVVKDSLFQTVFAVVQKILLVADEKVLDICVKRMGAMDCERAWNDCLLECDEAALSLDKNDQAILIDQKKELQKALHNVKSFKKELKEKVKETKSTKVKKRRTTSKTESSTSKPTSVKEGRIPHEEAKLYCPEGTYVWRCKQSGSWRGVMPGFPGISRAWSKYTEDVALFLVVQALWERWCDVNGVDHSECPMQGLF